MSASGVIAAGSQSGEVVLWRAAPIYGVPGDVDDVLRGLGWGSGTVCPASRRQAKFKQSLKLKPEPVLEAPPADPEPMPEEPEPSEEDWWYMWLHGNVESRVHERRKGIWETKLREDARPLESEECNAGIAEPTGPRPRRIKTYGEYRRQALLLQREEQDRPTATGGTPQVRGNFQLAMAFGVWHATATPHAAPTREGGEEPVFACPLCKHGRERRQAYEDLNGALRTMRAMHAMLQTAKLKATRADKAYVTLESRAIERDIVRIIPRKPLFQDPPPLEQLPLAPVEEKSCWSCACSEAKEPERAPLAHLNPQPIGLKRGFEPDKWGEAHCGRCGRPGTTFDIRTGHKKDPVSATMRHQMSFIDEATRRGVREAARSAESAQLRFESGLQRLWHQFEERAWRKIEAVQASIFLRFQLTNAMEKFRGERSRMRDRQAEHRLSSLSQGVWLRGLKGELAAVRRVKKSLQQGVLSGEFRDSSQ